MYIVSGGYDSKGTCEDDSNDLNKYYELGWECVVSNICIKNLLDLGKISKEDTVVTNEDRKFIYSSVFDNVIDWDTFKQLNVDKSKIYSVDYLNFSSLVDLSKVNKELICDFDLIENIEEQFNITDNFICYCVRLRTHSNYRNSSVEVAKKVISNVVNNLKMKVFVVGQGAEFLCDNKNVIHVGLREFSSLMNSKKCKGCISKLSGIIHLVNFCGHENLVNIIYDPTKDRSKVKNHVLYMSDDINYRNNTNIFIEMPESESLTMELINNYIL